MSGSSAMWVSNDYKYNIVTTLTFTIDLALFDTHLFNTKKGYYYDLAYWSILFTLSTMRWPRPSLSLLFSNQETGLTGDMKASPWLDPKQTADFPTLWPKWIGCSWLAARTRRGCRGDFILWWVSSHKGFLLQTCILCRNIVFHRGSVNKKPNNKH